MAGPYGLLPTGFNIKTLSDLKAELEADYKAAFGTSVGSNPDGTIPAQSAMGQQIGIISERFAEVWELGQAVNSSTDPDKAEDSALDTVCAITGTIRNPQRESTVIETATGDPGTVLNVGRVVSVQGAATRFTSEVPGAVPVTLMALPVWAATTLQAIGDRVVSDTPEKVYQALTAGTTGMVAITGQGQSITDGTVLWRYLGDGSAAADFPMQAEVAGPFAAISGTLSEIETPVSGWISAVNVLDATVGAAKEGNPALRIRRENELQAGGESPLNAIRANILEVGKFTANPVIACMVFENTTMLTNADGLPPKSVEVLALGGVDQDIRERVFNSVCGGIQKYGNNVGTVVDTAGNVHTVGFSRPTDKIIYIEVDLQKIDGQYPIDGDDAVKAAIMADTVFPKYTFGVDVVWSAISASARKVTGVFDITAVRIGLAALPVGNARITVLTREIARFDTSRIVVASTNTTP